MSDTVMCRVCETPTPPQDDAVLLCSACRANPDVTRTMVEDVFSSAIDAASALLERASVETARRVVAMQEALVASKGDPAARLRFERRYQASIAQGDELSPILQAFARCRATRQWRDRALQEIDALADEVLR